MYRNGFHRTSLLSIVELRLPPQRRGKKKWRCRYKRKAKMWSAVRSRFDCVSQKKCSCDAQCRPLLTSRVKIGTSVCIASTEVSSVKHVGKTNHPSKAKECCRTTCPCRCGERSPCPLRVASAADPTSPPPPTVAAAPAPPFACHGTKTRTRNASRRGEEKKKVRVIHARRNSIPFLYCANKVRRSRE